MTKLTVILVCLLFCKSVISQDSLFIQLANDAVHSFNKTDTIYYSDSSMRFYNRFSSYARNGKMESNTEFNQKVSMTFTREELNEIDKQFATQQKIRWPEYMLPNSVRLQADSIANFIKYLYSREFQKSPVFRYYYHFSQPAFLRNNTVAIFRLARMIEPSAGDDFIMIYEKQNDQWKQKLKIYKGSW